MRLFRGTDTEVFDAATQRAAGAQQYARKLDATVPQRGTVVDTDALNAVFRELVHLAELGGQTLDPMGDHDQAAEALAGAQGITSAKGPTAIAAGT